MAASWWLMAAAVGVAQQRKGSDSDSNNNTPSAGSGGAGGGATMPSEKLATQFTHTFAGIKREMDAASCKEVRQNLNISFDKWTVKRSFLLRW